DVQPGAWRVNRTRTVLRRRRWDSASAPACRVARHWPRRRHSRIATDLMGAAALAARIHSPTALSLANTIQGTAAGRAIAGGARGVAWAGALLLAVAVLKAAAILLDPQIRLFLGDSASYLFAARSDEWLPGDRSFTYPLLLESLVRPTGSLQALLYWQALA